MNETLLGYYEQELRYLREMGGEFATAFPKVAARLGLDAFECADPYVERLLEGFSFLSARVRMELDPEVDAEYPRRWIGKVDVQTTDGRVLSARVDTPKGDPGNPLSRDELLEKAVRLGEFAGAAREDEVRAVAKRIWAIDGESRVGFLRSS